MSDEPILLTCDYCEYEGEYGKAIEANPNGGWRCIDPKACDERWSESHPEDGDD